MSEPLSTLQPKDVQIDDKLLKKTFLEHLNYIYFGKQHLVDFFNEVEGIAKLNVLEQAIQELIDDTESQLKSLDEIYVAIKETPTKTATLSLKATTLEAY